MLAALADDTRRTIFERVATAPSPVGELARGLAVSRPAVSQHLRVLKEAELTAGALYDVFPVRMVHRVGSTLVLLASWPFFHAVSAPGATNLVWTLAGFGALGGVMGGAFAVVLAGLFPAPVRFSGVALAFSTSFAVFSGLAPAAATGPIFSTGDKAAPAFYLAGAAVVALVAGLWIRKPTALGGPDGAGRGGDH